MNHDLGKKYNNLKTFFDSEGFASLETLSPEETQFAYCMSMAAIAGYPICLFQLSPHPNIHSKIADFLTTNTNRTDSICDQLRIYWLYLFANYGCHNARETENNKMVPTDLGLDLITPASLTELGINLTQDEELYLFDKTYFPTATVETSIELSGSHFYGTGVTTALYSELPIENRNKLNGYYELIDGNVVSQTYSTKNVCAKYMTHCVKWFNRALEIARSAPDYFDTHTVASLSYLIKYYESGDEADFKLHCTEWLKMNNPKVEYTTGFIEYYDDPLSKIGTYQSDVTIKSLNIDVLLKLLPSFEERFPFPREWKRQNMEILPNAATAHKIMGLGGLGPVLSTIAYCLPNYNDLRSQLGSKQVMYTLPQPSDLDRYKKIYLSTTEQSFFEKYSPDMKLASVMDSLCTTLHETIGHASGANANHITNEIKSEQIGKWTNGLEEMRAEILALYTGTHFLQEIIDSGILDNWGQLVPLEKLWELQLQHIAGGGWTRWRSTPVGSTEVKQAHALADTGIMYYLIDHSQGALELTEEIINLDGVDSSVLRLVVHDIHKILPIIEQLAIEVQKLSSNAVFTEIDEFMKKYAISTRNTRYSGIVREMKDKYTQGVSQTIQIFPEWEALNGAMIARIPTDPIQSTLNIWKLAQGDD